MFPPQINLLSDVINIVKYDDKKNDTGTMLTIIIERDKPDLDQIGGVDLDRIAHELIENQNDSDFMRVMRRDIYLKYDAICLPDGAVIYEGRAHDTPQQQYLRLQQIHDYLDDIERMIPLERIRHLYPDIAFDRLCELGHIKAIYRFISLLLIDPTKFSM